MSRHDEPTNNVPLSGAEMAGFMNWRGPGAYTAHAERRIVRLIAEAVRREREACAQVVDRSAEACRANSELHDVLSANAIAIRARGAA